jgi:hypothetical protein
LQRLKKKVEGELELMCSRAARTEKMSPVASALADRGILHPHRVSFLEKEKGSLACVLLVSFKFPYLRLSLFLQGLFWGGTNAPVLPMGSPRVGEMESIAVPASVRGNVEGLVCKVALLEGELVEAHRAHEVTEEKVRSLSSSSTKGARRLVSFEMERREQFKKLSLLWAWGTELCLTIISSSQVKSPLPVKMWDAALCHTVVVGELTTLRTAVSSAAELMLGCSPD